MNNWKQLHNAKTQAGIKAAAELELRKRKRERERLRKTLQEKTFNSWLWNVSPTFSWDAPHLRLIQSKLEQLSSGEIQKLMIFVPPRHGKSELATVRFPLWSLQKNPKLRALIGAYNQDFASEFSRKIRRLARDRVQISGEKDTEKYWETIEGGSVRATGVGVGVAGKGADLIVIDDPIRNWEEANSPAYREKTWNWYVHDIYTRREPDAKMILIQTRWHEDDLAGRILTSEDSKNWTVISLPALAESEDQLGRAAGAALWPERFNDSHLRELQKFMGNGFFALYQQRPQQPSGGIFPTQRIRIVPVPPTEILYRVRCWDFAATEGGGDYTAGVKMAVTKEKRLVVENVVRDRLNTHDRNHLIQQTAWLDGRDTQIWIEEEGGSSGKDASRLQIQMLLGFQAGAHRPTGSKLVRAGIFAAQVQGENVDLVEGDWNRDFLEELKTFPTGSHDDQVDAAAMCAVHLSNYLFSTESKSIPTSAIGFNHNPLKIQW